MEIMLHSKNSVSIKILTEIVPFQQVRVRIPNLVRCKIMQLDFRSRVKKSDSWCSHEFNSTQKPPTPCNSGYYIIRN